MHCALPLLSGLTPATGPMRSPRTIQALANQEGISSPWLAYSSSALPCCLYKAVLPLIWAATATAVLATCYALANIHISSLFIPCLLFSGVPSKVEAGWVLLSALRAFGLVMGVSQGVFECQGAWPGALHYNGASDGFLFCSVKGI